MTDKEQIKIDGIQFNKFGDFYVDYDFNSKFQSISSSSKEYKILKSLIEQLARKTQEYTELKEDYNELEHRHNEAFQDFERLKHECEELKEELATYKKMLDNPEFKIALIDVKTGEREVWRKLGNKAQKCKQALDEIEKELKEDIHCESQECGCDDFEECLNCVKTQILDIINKAIRIIM